MEEAVLPRFNTRFGVTAQVTMKLPIEPWTKCMCLVRILCYKYRRRVARDNIGQIQLAHPTTAARHGTAPSYAGAVVECT